MTWRKDTDATEHLGLGLEGVLDALDPERRRRSAGSGWMVRCPAHEDATPSLSVWLDDKGWVALNCHAGCDRDDILRSSRLAVADLGPQKVTSNGHGRTRTVVRRREFRTSLAEGVGAATHLRLDYDDGTKQCPWEPKGTRSARVHLYRPDGLDLAALPDGAEVIVAEGEPKAAALYGFAGLAAVASMTGADHTPCDAALAVLVRLRVILWPDNDPAGIKHMRAIAAALHRLGCRDVVVLTWPDAPSKGDAVDFLRAQREAGATGDAARAAVDALPRTPWSPDDQQEADGQAPVTLVDTWQAKLIRGDDVNSVRLPPPAPLVEDHIYSGTVAMFCGQGGAFKSLAALDVALCHATGQRWGRWRVETGRSLYIASEGTSGIGKRADAWRRHRGVTSTPDFLLYPEPVDLNDRSHRAALVELVRLEGATLVVLDTLTDMSGGADENSAGEMAVVMGTARAIAMETGATVLIVHHAAKDRTTYRGSTAIRNALDTMLVFEAVEGGFRVGHDKQRDAAPSPASRWRVERVSWFDSMVAVLDETPLTGEGLSDSHMRVLAVLAATDSHCMLSDELRKAADYQGSDRHWPNLINDLARHTLVRVEDRGKGLPRMVRLTASGMEATNPAHPAEPCNAGSQGSRPSNPADPARSLGSAGSQGGPPISDAAPCITCGKPTRVRPSAHGDRAWCDTCSRWSR